MSPEAIRAAAHRNRQLRAEQLARLAPLRQVPASDLRGLREQVKARQADIQTMTSLSHVPNFFPTPRALGERMIGLADLRTGLRVLEPSAGKGDLAQLITAAGASVECIELVPRLAEMLSTRGLGVKCADFLSLPPQAEFDRVVMNPPFERGIDEKHVRHALEFLKPGGRLVAVVGAMTGRRLETWAADQSGWVEALPPNTFATGTRPTSVNTALVVAYR